MKTLVRDSATLLGSSFLANVMSLVFWLFMVRRLPAHDYALLNALVALMCLVTVPLGVVQTVVTRYVARLSARSSLEDVRCLLVFFFKRLSLFGVVVVLLFSLGAGRIAAFLHSEQTGASLWLMLGILASIFSVLTMGTLFGTERFLAVAADNVVCGLTKLGAGCLLVVFGFGVLGGLAGFILSHVVLLALSCAQVLPRLPGRCAKAGSVSLQTSEIYSYFLPTALCLFCFYALTNMDIILVKHLYSPADAGRYSVAQIVGKILLFLPAALGSVMFPKIAACQARREDPLVVLRPILLATALLCGAAAAAVAWMPGLILRLLTGQALPQNFLLAGMFAVSMGLYACVYVLMLYHLALHEKTYIMVMALVTLLQGAGIWFLHPGLVGIQGILVACALLLLSAGILTSRVGLVHEKS